MKFFIVFALFALVAAKPSLRLDEEEINEIVDAIESPNANHAILEALKEKLRKILDLIRPAEGYQPVQVGPTPVETESFEPIQVGPAVVDFPVPESAITPTPVSSPLVQIIVNVRKPEDFVGGSPVVVEGLDKPEPIEKPTPVQVVETNPVVIEPVIVADNLPLPSEPVNVAPIIISPIAVGPEILN